MRHKVQHPLILGTPLFVYLVICSDNDYVHCLLIFTCSYISIAFWYCSSWAAYEATFSRHLFAELKWEMKHTETITGFLLFLYIHNLLKTLLLINTLYYTANTYMSIVTAAPKRLRNPFPLSAKISEIQVWFKVIRSEPNLLKCCWSLLIVSDK